MLKYVRERPGTFTFDIVGNIVNEDLSQIVILNKVGQVVRPDTASLAVTDELATMDANLIVDSRDVDPTSRAWPFTFTTYVIMQRDTITDDADCSTPKTVLKFFTWVQTNDLAILNANELGDTLPFKFLRAVVQTLQLNITCNGALASDGLGDVLLTGGSLVTTPFKKMAPLYEALDPKHPTVFMALRTSYAMDLLVTQQEADAIIVESPIPDDVLAAHNLFHIPLALGPIVLAFNIPGLGSDSKLVLSLDAVIGIYDGSITRWNDKMIVKDNWDLIHSLPNELINVVVRSDSDGTTRPFTEALARHNPAFKPGASSTPNWPSSFVYRALHPAGMAAMVASTPYSIGYMGIDTALGQELAILGLINEHGDRVFPTHESVNANVDAFNTDLIANNVKQGKGTSLMSNYGGPMAWPLTATAYFATRRVVPAGMRCEPYSWIASYITWFLTSTEARNTLQSVYFVPLPLEYGPEVLELLAAMRCNGQPLQISELSSDCPISNGNVCGGPDKGTCAVNPDIGELRCFCEPGWTDNDCLTPIPAKVSHLKRDVGLGIGVGTASMMLIMLAFFAMWRRLSKPPVWLVSRYDFTLDSVIARGGFSVVFLGSWKATKVAVKVMRTRVRRGQSGNVNMKDILIDGDGALEAQLHVAVNDGEPSLDMIKSGASGGKTQTPSIPLTSAHDQQDAVNLPGSVPHHSVTFSKAPTQPSSSPHSSQALMSGSVGGRSGRLLSRDAYGRKIRASGPSQLNSANTRNTKGNTTKNGMANASSVVLNEVNIISKLRHPNVAFMIAASFFNDHLFMLIEYMDAGSLFDALRNQMLDLSPSVRIRIMLDACRGLSFLHQQNPPVLHMDLKTPNILVDSRFTAKLTDFGLSSVRAKVATEGTLPWTAPEVIAGQVYTKASDIYSIGIVLWELQNMRATAPWEGRTQTQIRDAIASNERPPLSDEHCPLGKPYAELIRRCWAANPLERPPIEEVARTIDKILGSAPKLDSQWFQRNTTKMSQIVKDLPASMQAEIARGDPVTPLPLESVTMIFTDIVGFTRWSSERSAQDVSEMLAKLHDGLFDKLVARHGGFHLETIGDAYIVVLNFPHNVDNHVERAARLAFAMCAATETLGMKIRAGVHTGPAVATVVGTTHPKLTLLGDTVNTASRMETISPPGKVTVSDAVKLELNETFVLSKGKLQEIKGKGLMQTFVIDDLAPTLEV
eukprot:comp22538_c0_seq2/m.56961 comp22538_c0_seq2/g.56961  ORF comp22538_c0_seq2/g.56961 comp22538_c0_seq2/m.56961 type:complete len:1203 (-) comp22538_c0_seq2:65-3673(-)